MYACLFALSIQIGDQCSKKLLHTGQKLEPYYNVVRPYVCYTVGDHLRMSVSQHVAKPNPCHVNAPS